MDGVDVPVGPVNMYDVRRVSADVDACEKINPPSSMR